MQDFRIYLWKYQLQIDRQRDRQTDKHCTLQDFMHLSQKIPITDRETERQTERQTYRHTNIILYKISWIYPRKYPSQTERQRDRQTDRQTDRQILMHLSLPPPLKGRAGCNSTSKFNLHLSAIFLPAQSGPLSVLCNLHIKDTTTRGWCSETWILRWGKNWILIFVCVCPRE